MDDAEKEACRRRSFPLVTREAMTGVAKTKAPA
jgi:hypothetical protein